MATNPITSDDLTIDFQSLLAIPIGDRVQAAALDTGFSKALIASLTPIQMAKAFPDYYRKELPDISNFILANRYLDKVGAGGFDQRGGGDYGKDYNRYGGETAVPSNRVPAGAEPSIDDMKKTLLRKGIDIEGTYSAIEQGGAILEGDTRFSYIKTMSDEELKKAGFERIQDENGKNLIRLLPTEASALSEEEVMKRSAGKVAPGTGDLEGKQKTQKQVYDSFIKAGFSDRQAVALTAEVGRENGYNQKTLFGTHQDANNGQVNLGMFSWQGDRRPALMKYLNEQGVIDKNGQMIPGQESLDAMARFTKIEMETNPGYARTRKIFLENPNVDQATAAQVLGSNYISWDMTGKYGLRNPEEHAAKRDAFYNQLDEINKKFPGLIPDNPTKDQIEAARQQLISQEQQGRKLNLIKELYDAPSPTTTQTAVSAMPVPEEFKTLSEYYKFMQQNYPDKIDVNSPMWDNVNPSLKAVRDRLIASGAADNKGGYVNRDTLIAVDSQLRMASKYGLSFRAVPGGGGDDEHSMNHGGVGRDTNYSIDVQYYDKEGKPVYFGDLPTDVKQNLMLASVAAGANRLGAATNGYNAAFHTQSDANMSTAIWGYTGNKEHSRASLVQSKEGMQLAKTFDQNVGHAGQINPDLLDSIGLEKQPPKETETAKPSDTPVNTATVETPAPKFRTGGSPETQDDENLSVYDEDGNIRWKMNSGEGVYVKPEANEYADTKMEELSGRVDEIDERMSNQPKQADNRPTPNKPEKNWQQHVANMTYAPGSQGRAFKRTKFQNEGFHWGRGSPNSSLS